MHHPSHRRSAHARALRLDFAAIGQVGLAAAITFVVAWAIQVL